MNDNYPYQPNLPGMELGITVAEAAWIRLAEEWRYRLETAPASGPLPRHADETALAALLLATEYGADFTSRAVHLAEANCELVSEIRPYFYDPLLWRLAHSCIGRKNPDPAPYSFLAEQLTHHQSSIRMWLTEMAWTVRTRLPIEEATDALLQNIADKLAGVGQSAGLLAALYPDKEELDRRADRFDAATFDSQYRDRLKEIREREWNSFAFNLWLIEVNSRKRIFEAVAKRPL